MKRSEIRSPHARFGNVSEVKQIMIMLIQNVIPDTVSYKGNLVNG